MESARQGWKALRFPSGLWHHEATIALGEENGLAQSAQAGSTGLGLGLSQSPPAASSLGPASESQRAKSRGCGSDTTVAA